MASFNDVVQPECGRPNPLVDFANRICSISESKSRPAQSSKRTSDNDFVHEYFEKRAAQQIAPATFDMRSLLRSVKNFESESIDSSSPINSKGIFSNDWTAEYNLLHCKSIDQQSSSLVTPQNTIFNHIWDIDPSKLIIDDSKWSVEYLIEADKEKTFSASHVFNSVDVCDQNDDISESWTNEFKNFIASKSNDIVHKTDDDESDWIASYVEATDWIADYAKKFHTAAVEEEYELSPNNPYSSVDDPLVVGKRLLKIGLLSQAILHFESAVQKQPNSTEAWQYLGQAQAENENEPKTIAALQKCLKLDPTNRQALSLLSTAYVNEGLYDLACRSLFEWLKLSNKYPSVAQTFQMDVSASFFNPTTMRQLEEAFLRAISGNPADAELQNALGILYNISGDLPKAADCFKMALSISPKDARLWNKLGATLANDDRPAEAIHAYRKALEIYPAFVRARYNLGVACLNLGSHEQAVEHLVSALTLQQDGLGPSEAQCVSHGIWNTLRIAVCATSRPDKAELLKLIETKNYEKLALYYSSFNLSSTSHNT